MKNFRNAINDFERIIQFHSVSTEFLRAYYRRGSAYIELAEMETAISDFWQVVVEYIKIIVIISQLQLKESTTNVHIF